MSAGEATATIRFFGADLDPDELTRLLGSTPTHSNRAGDKLESGHVLKEGSWRLNTGYGSFDDLGKQVSGLLAALTDDIPTWRDLSARYRADVFCGAFLNDPVDGFGLEPALLGEIAARRLTLGLCLYEKPFEALAEAQLFVRDLESALEHYVEALGFGVEFRHGDPAFYAQVRRGSARLNLRQTDLPPFDAAFLKSERDVIVATVTVPEIERLAEELTATGAVFHRKLHTEPWGARTFIVGDPDGNLICFAG